MSEPTPTPPTNTEFTETLKIAAYGKFGARKTLQIAGLIRAYGPENVLIVSAEHGLNTIRSSITLPEQVVTVNNLEELRKAWKDRIAAFASPDHWICIDGATRIMDWMANEQLSGAEKIYELRARRVPETEIPDALKQYGRYLTDKGGIDTMRIYGRVGRDSQNTLSAWVGLSANLYVTYLEDLTRSDGYAKIPPYGPDVPGQVGLKAVMSSFDYVVRLTYDADGQLIGQLDPASNLYLARTREDRAAGLTLPKEIPEFDLVGFVGLIRGAPAKAE